jgi:WD40 repeat protein
MSGIAKKLISASRPPVTTGSYIAAARVNPDELVLFDHTNKGNIFVSDTYSLAADCKSKIDFSRDGQYIAVAQEASPGLLLIDHTTPGSLSLSDSFGSRTGGGVAFSPTEDYLCFTEGTTLHLVDYSDPTSIVSVDTYSLSGSSPTVSFSPDGNYVIVGQGDDLILLDHTTSGTLTFSDENTPDGGSDVLSCDFDSTGDYIVVSIDQEFTDNVYLIDHTTPGTLVSSSSQEVRDEAVFGVRFSPDDSYVIAFYGPADESASIFEITSPGTFGFIISKFGSGSGQAQCGDWSNEGDYICYGDTDDFYLYDVTTPSLPVLADTETLDPGTFYRAVFSPN